MSNLPKGWRAILLNEVVDKIVGGGTPSKSVPSYYEGDIPWMTVKDMNKSYLTDTIDHITQEAIDNSSTNVIPAGTPIIATRMSLGKIVRASFDSAINQDLKALFVNREVDDYYFEYWYRSQGLKIESLGTGTTVKGVRLEVINALEFPLAPLAEQKRIVEKLDEVLVQVDTIKARLDGIPDLLKRFRQSVLASAVAGKLTEEWSGEKNDGTAMSLKSMTTKIGSGSTPKGGQAAYKTEGIPLVRSMNIHSTFIKYDDLAFIDEAQAEKLKNVIIDLDDVLLNITGASIGRVNLAPESFVGGRVNQHVSIIRCNRSILLPHYLHIYLASPKMQKWIEGENYGATRQALTKSMIESLELNPPSVEEQKEIVRLVDQYFAFADTIEAQVKKAQARVDNLTQSILAKAFRGELVPQDPSDESADKLLERIAQARKEAEALAKATNLYA